MRLENKMKLYHGTDACFGEIQITGHSSPFRDFGEGFYLTSFFEQARSQAQRKAQRNVGGKKAYVYKYEVRCFDRSKYRILELLHYDKSWLDFLEYNRVYGGKKRGAPRNWQNLDIVYDRMADNRWSTITEDLGRYSRNEIGSDEVISDLAKSGQWDQYCFKTESSLGLLVRLEIADVSV